MIKIKKINKISSTLNRFPRRLCESVDLHHNQNPEPDPGRELS